MQFNLLEAPEGTRDLLGDGARRLRACEAKIGAVFQQAKYEEVIPPTIERAELFEDLAALRTSDGAGRALALRADFTSQVARIASSRMPGRAPLRLWYRGSVVRDVPSGRMVPRERFQCGLELLGLTDVAADAEVLALASRALDAVGLGERDVRLSVGTTAYFEAILTHLGVSKRLALQLRDCIDRKDRSGTAALLNDLAPGAARDALAFLAAPEAQTSVLDVARQLAPNDEARIAIERLSKVIDAARGFGLGDRLEIDLGEVRGLGYYTGLVFNVYAAGAPGPVGGGGRYDSLLARFGDPRPAVGCSIDLDAIAPLASVGES
jgi:ATP phosphoribosyltransferase regulatory subunit